ncbi:DUF397 domain-containing protein [Salinactinospora qingdaonensis]|uniref:DUF397 domain-containing protein n=1 Tax=Salinactinospora qingdaonensis TaxID=702744 RepID=A0ABP7FMH8_9ACTN
MTVTGWHTSTYSNGGTNCVEVRETSERADVRDSQNRERGHLSFSSAEWGAFLDAVRNDGV